MGKSFNTVYFPIWQEKFNSLFLFSLFFWSLPSFIFKSWFLFILFHFYPEIVPIQHSPPARQTSSQARTQAVLTPTPRAPLDGNPEVPQLRAHLDRGPNVEGEEPSRKEGRVPRRSSSFSGVVGRFTGLSRTTLKGPGEDGEEEEENSVEEEGSDGTEGIPALVGASQGTGGPTLAQSNQPFSHQSEPSLLAIMQQMTQIMANLQAASSTPAFKTPSMKASECFDGTQPFKVRSFIQSYSHYLLNSWTLFESQLFTLFGDPNEVRKAEAELYSLRMKEGGHVSLYIADFRSLVSIIGDWGERALIHHFRKGFPSRRLDQLASHPSSIDSLQDLMDITLELDTRYHEGQNEKIHHQEKKPEASKSNSSNPQNSSISSRKKKNFQKRDKPHPSLLNKDFNLMNSEKERRIKQVLYTYCVGKHSLESCFKRPQNKLTQLQGLITFNSDHKDYHDPSKSFSNDLSSAKSCAALVGYSRTTSFPSSVHNPSLNSHQSLLSSRDEVFKEIQDVGEDNSVSSLHLFFGNMDLPPSSYHNSLEELWDEEEEPEEIETMMKVVPSVYHNYLDVFSKVKQRNFLLTAPVIIILSWRGLYLQLG
ncbi:hypothetical protein O181_040102 [Austropuccinia psidii MF-1]|uniref:Retrotransposon gag domain-containing protein n=1 Tax=Austropuccinia psidii MF-1 TaxID=1389203 RepID=A0A9Q3DI44_9BASI|nr:hypothetical protein [Austropuccinia psidii MF-1]